MRREGPPAPDCSAFGAIEGTRTPTPLRVHGPEPCASANSATMAKSDSVTGRPLRRPFQERTTIIFYRGIGDCQTPQRPPLSSNPRLAFEFRRHRNIRFERLGNGAAALGILRCLLEGSLIGVGHVADDVEMNRSDGPARIELLHC